MSPPLSQPTYDLSGQFRPRTVPKGSLLTGRTFHEIHLYGAAYVVSRCCSRSIDDPYVLAEALRAACTDTTKHKLLVINNVPGVDLLPSEDWDSVFSPLRSDQSSLEAISVHCTGMMYSAVCSQIGHLLAKSSTLEFLWFGSLASSTYADDLPSSCLSDGVVKTLSEGLVQTKSLRGVGLNTRVLDREFADVLNTAFTANAQNTSLEWIDLPAHVERFDMVLEVLLISNRYKNLKKIRIGLPSYLVPEHTVDNFRTLAESLRRWEGSEFDTSRAVRVDFGVFDDSSESDQRVLLSCWDKWVSANECALMLETRLDMWDNGEGWDVWISEMPKRFTQLKNLHIRLGWAKMHTVRDMDQLSLLCKGIQSADTVESIYIYGTDHILVNCCPPLFQCLQHKRGLKGLTLEGDWYVEEVFRCLMDFLEVNIYVEKVGLKGGKSGPDTKGKTVLVQEAVNRNRDQATYFSTLRDAKLPFEEAKAARVFLCGHSHAGKTTLRVTMMKTRKKESRVVKYFTRKLGLPRKLGKGQPLKRTKGVDVELMRDDNQMQVSIWDLAGQEIFRALQSLLLPVVTQACVFVFVFSPFEDDQCHIKEHLEVSFKLKLRSWLCYVASHYPITGTFLPEVLVVITHKDKMQQYGRDLGCEWGPIVDHFRAEYGRVLNLYATPWYVDAWNEEDVYPFVEKLYALVSEMLSKKTPQAPSVCCKLISEILDPKDASSSQMAAKPVWSIQDFYTHISKRLEALSIGSFHQSVETQRRVLEAMIRYMHDAGSIFYLPKSQLVVGTLVTILKELSEICHKKKVTVDPQVLQDLLVNLDLCYSNGNVEGVQEFFMPTIFGRNNTRGENLTWRTAPSSGSEWQYFGYRLLCADTNTTSLTAATFPRFQIRFRKEMVGNDETCILQRDVMRLDHNREGYSIIIQNSEEGAHIDVLFQFLKRKMRDDAMEYVQKRILKEFRKFCASREGCRGVTLETAIIRPECVRRLTPQKYRKEQIILESQLKDFFRKAVEKKFNVGQVVWPQGDGGDLDLFNYEHFWKEAPEAGLFKDPQQAIELLSRRDVEEIMEPLRETLKLTEVEQQLDSQLQQSADRAERHSWRSQGGSSSYFQEDRRLFNEIHEHLDDMEKRLKLHVDNRVECIRRDIQQLQEHVHSALLSIITKIDTMVGYSRALEDARVPRLPFITFTDVQFHQRLISVVQIGTPVRLHLMCESRFRPHTIDDQPGLKLTLGNENKEWLRYISLNALKVFWALLKAGINSQLPGVGEFIPELGDLSSGVVPVAEITLDELENAKLSSLPRVEGSEMAKDMWKFLQRTLLREKIPEAFKLQLVRYNAGTMAADKAYAWLCQKCVDEGEKNKVLTSFLFFVHPLNWKLQ
ncbi:hypothetical protein R1sor_020614 [Riccia sorocarpa]|uniref:Uncharacterized protein n=1 Tax=Riccia sorocarpa TaxID=122646 RepID=A0ABD3GEQ6_9MARC